MYYHVNFLYSYFHLPNSFRLTWVICTFISCRRGPHSFEWNTLCIPEPTSSHYIQHLHLKAEDLHTKSCKPRFTRITYTPDQDIETQTKWSHFLRRHLQLNFVYDYSILIPFSLKLGSSGSISNKPTFQHLSQWWSSLLPHIYVSLGLDELKTACIIDKTWIITSHLSFKSLFIRDKSDNPVWPQCRWHQGDHAPK